MPWQNGFLVQHVFSKFCYCFFSQTILKCSSHIKWDILIFSSSRLLLKVWIWYRCQNRKLLSPLWRAIRFLEKSKFQNPHKLSEKKACPCNLCIARNEEFQFIWQKPFSKKTSNAIQHEKSWLRGIVLE